MAKTAIRKSIKLFGTDESVVKQRVVTAGHIQAVLDNGSLRYICYRGTEVLRGISFLVRDKNWGTYAAVISSLKVKQAKTGFTISYHAECKDAAQEIHYDAKIEAIDGRLTFSAIGHPMTDVLTNRTGFVVLHPLTGVVGQPMEIVHTDGKRRKSKFPKIISPGQPVFKIRSLKHLVMPGVLATVVMEGNTFEMEDHRNWMDASYKTYVCSLLDPWPYTLLKGKSFEQSITLTLDGKPKQPVRTIKSDRISISLGSVAGKLPTLGIGVPMAQANDAQAASETIKALQLSSLVCQIDGRLGGQEVAARAFDSLSKLTGVPVKLEIILPAKDSATIEINAVADAAKAAGLNPQSVVVTQMHDLKSFQPNTPRPWGPSYEEMAAAARTAFPGASIGGGMLSYFTELNRKPVPKGLFDFVTHTVCPIVHAADDISVMETLESLPWIFASTRAMIGKQSYHIGPSGIPCRDNPYGAAVAANRNNERMCLSDVDPRQSGLFAAAWNVGLLAAAAASKVDAIALGAVTGSRGVISPAGVNPVYWVLHSMGAFKDGRHVVTSSTAPGVVVALACQSKHGRGLWLANLTAKRQVAKVNGFSGAVMKTVLDEKNFDRATKGNNVLSMNREKLNELSEVELSPYAVVQFCSV
jgi:D-apionolactonase